MDALTVIGGMNSTLAGAIIGAVGAITGGFVGAWIVSSRDERRRQAEHKAAVRAVLQELAGNMAVLKFCKAKGSANELAVVHVAYSSLQLPLFSAGLPEDVAIKLGDAYRRLLAVDKVASNAKWDLFLSGEASYEAAGLALGEYARDTLKL